VLLADVNGSMELAEQVDPEVWPHIVGRLRDKVYAVYSTASERGSTMAVRLNITMDPNLYQRLKRELPAKQISRFINDAVRAHLQPDRATLDAAYKAARKEAWRRDLAADWDVTETEGWPR